MKKIVVDLENEMVLEGVAEIPQSSMIFTGEHIDYVDALTGNIIHNDLKGCLLNIIEGIGMPEKQETAIKRQIINALHDVHRHIYECIELVKASKDCSTCIHKYSGTIESADICRDCKIISRGYTKYSFNTGHADTGSIGE